MAKSKIKEARAQDKAEAETKVEADRNATNGAVDARADADEKKKAVDDAKKAVTAAKDQAGRAKAIQALNAAKNKHAEALKAAQDAETKASKAKAAAIGLESGAAAEEKRKAWNDRIRRTSRVPLQRQSPIP